MRNRCVWRALYDLEDFAGLGFQLEKQCGQLVYVSGALSILCFRSESAFPFLCPSGNNAQILEKKKTINQEYYTDKPLSNTRQLGPATEV